MIFCVERRQLKDLKGLLMDTIVKLTVGLFLLYFLCGAPLIFSNSTGELIVEPRPTHVEKKYVKLVLVKEIREDIDNTHFMAQPSSLAVDDENNLYAYDKILKKIFKFDKEYRLERVFGRQGRGPGEFHGGDPGVGKLYFGSDGRLYACDSYNRKIIVFDKKGNHLKDIHLPPERQEVKSFFPVVDAKKNFYILSTHKGAVDVYDERMNLKHTCLEEANYNRFLIHKPGYPKRVPFNPTLQPDITNTYYDILSSNRLVVYLMNSSTAFVFRTQKVIRQFDLWPEKALAEYKDRIEEFRGNKKLKYWSTPFALNFFVDKDNGEYFYLSLLGGTAFYKFNLKGELLYVLHTKPYCDLKIKRNKLFYGIRRGRIQIFQEGEI